MLYELYPYLIRTMSSTVLSLVPIALRAGGFGAVLGLSLILALWLIADTTDFRSVPKQHRSSPVYEDPGLCVPQATPAPPESCEDPC